MSQDPFSAGIKEDEVTGVNGAWSGADKDWEDNFSQVSSGQSTVGEAEDIALRAKRNENVKELISRDAGDVEAQVTRDTDKYLWCMMFVNENHEQCELDQKEKEEVTTFRRETVNKLRKLGLEVFQKHRSRDDDEFYVKFGASQRWLEEMAEQLETPVKLKNGGYVPFVRAKKSMFWCLPEADPDNYDKTEEDYSKRIGADPGTAAGSDKFRFSSAQKLAIIMEILEAKEAFGGAGLNFGKLIKEGKLLQFYPAHDQEDLEWLKKYWGNFKLMYPWREFINQPLERVREYFGTRLALYFTFLGVYTQQLVIPTVLGFITWIIQLATGGVDAKSAVPLYSFSIILWNTLLLEHWKRKEITCAWLWGTIGFESEEGARPDFEGVQRKNPVTGAPELWYPPERRRVKTSMSALFILLSVLVVFSGVVLVFAFRYFIAENVSAKLAGVTGIVNGIMIAVFNAVYTGIAIKLNDWENHKTDTEYDDSLIIKNFSFQFINNYGPFYLVAFLKSNVEYFGLGAVLGPCECHTYDCEPSTSQYYNPQFCTTNADHCTNNDVLDHAYGCHCKETSCLQELMVLLISIFGVNLFIGNMLEFGVPWIKARVNMYLEEKAMKQASAEAGNLDEEVAPMTQAEFEGKLQVYESPFEDYNEMILQLGFVSFFAVAFPLCALMALVNNVIEIRSDAFKLLAAHQRPEPRQAEDIGSWYTIMDVMTYISIATNCAVVFFVSSFGNEFSKDGKVWGFIIAEHIVVFLSLIHISEPTRPY
eukprot:TRINITY_DN3609_c0_g1_i2.p1 TRINITY_DN3609_c0_g1~~TRINITY_DN3609_c0_g1_i2.p1  ORF type:complete len:762 (-),score=247.85 TRINITY_DN3609_c0_g1_i2:108-2393(-)